MSGNRGKEIVLRLVAGPCKPSRFSFSFFPLQFPKPGLFLPCLEAHTCVQEDQELKVILRPH